MKDLDPSPALRIIGGPRQLATLEGRSVGILIADGSDATRVADLVAAVGEAGARSVIIAPGLAAQRCRTVRY